MADVKPQSTIREKSEKKTSSSKSSRKPKAQLKRSSLGFEVECFILDKNGMPTPQADLLLKKIAEEKPTNHEIINEVAENMIEVGSYPSLETTDTMQAMLNNLKQLLYTAEKNNLVICPLATYPGKFNPKIKNIDRYKAQQKLFGKTRFADAGRAVGFHFHYALPWGVFDTKKLTLKKLINSKNKQSLVNAYNFLIAADPAITTFLQSSPFYQGRHLAKDSRMLIYRGGAELGYAKGLYTNYPQFGALPFYRHTGTDLIDQIDSRHHAWLETLRQSGVRESELPKYKSPLDTNWAPVKINAHGTLEQRGMDMNHLQLIGSVSVLISTVLKAIQEDFFKVYASDIAVREPFKLDKKTIYIPPDTYVKKELQKNAAYKGLEDDAVWYYCKRLVSLVKLIAGKKAEVFLEPLEKMVKGRKTIADEIIEEAKKLGYTDFRKIMPTEIAASIALDHSKRLFKEIIIVQKMIEEINR